jgi:hypothetical protein
MGLLIFKMGLLTHDQLVMKRYPYCFVGVKMAWVLRGLLFIGLEITWRTLCFLLILGRELAVPSMFLHVYRHFFAGKVYYIWHLKI